MARPKNSEERKLICSSLISTLIKLRADGHKYQAIADLLNVGYATVYRAINGVDSMTKRTYPEHLIKQQAERHSANQVLALLTQKINPIHLRQDAENIAWNLAVDARMAPFKKQGIEFEFLEAA